MKTLVFTYYKIVENNGDFLDRGCYADFPYALKAIKEDFDWWDPNKPMWIYKVDMFKCDDGQIKIEQTVMYEKS